MNKQELYKKLDKEQSIEITKIIEEKKPLHCRAGTGNCRNDKRVKWIRRQL